MALTPRFKKQLRNEKPFGREQYISHFLNKFNNLSDTKFNVLHYHGIGGIGKSTLQRIFSETIASHDATINIFINFEEASNPEKFYSLVGSQLSKKIKLFYFEIAFAIYWSKLNPHIHLAKTDAKPIEETGFLSDVLSLVDGFGAAGAGAGLLSVINKYAKKINYLIKADYKNEIDELSDMSVSEIETMLPKFLAYDIDNYILKNNSVKIVFQLDTHEFLWEKIKIESKRLETDIWVRDLILSLPIPHTLFVISGRDKLKWFLDDPEWESIIGYNHLESFSFEDSLSFLLSNGIAEENIRTIIAKESEGVPFYLKLSLETYHSISEPNVSDFILGNNESIFNRFFQYIDKNESGLIKMLSLTKSFDKKLFAEIIDHFKIPFSIIDFDYIVDYSFVSSHQNTFSIHNLMKKSVENKIDQEMKKEFFLFLFNHFNNQISETISVEQVSHELFYNITNAFYYKSKLVAENSVVKWYVENFEHIVSQSDYIHELKNLYLFIIESSSKLYFKTKFQIKLGHIYLELGNIQKAEQIVDIIDGNDFSSNDKDWFDLLKIKILEGQKFISKDDKNSIDKKLTKLATSASNSEVKIIAFTSAGNIKRQLTQYDDSFDLFLQALNLVSDDTPLNTKIDLYFKMGYYYKDISDQTNFKKTTDLISSLINTNSKKSQYNKGLLERLIAENLLKLNQYEHALIHANKASSLFFESVGENASKTLTCQTIIGRIYHKQNKLPEINLSNKDQLIQIYKANKEPSLYNALHTLFSDSNRELIQLELTRFKIDKDFDILISLKNKLQRDNKYIGLNLLYLYKEIIISYIKVKDSNNIMLIATEVIDKLAFAGQNPELFDFIRFVNANSLLKEDVINLNKYALSVTKSDTLKLQIQFEFALILREYREYDKLVELIQPDLQKYEEFGLYSMLWKCYDFIFNAIRYKSKKDATFLMEEKIAKMKELDHKFFILEYSYKKILDLYTKDHEIKKRIEILESIVDLTSASKASKPEQYHEPLKELISLYKKTNQKRFQELTLDLLEFLLTQKELSKEFKLNFYATQKFFKENGNQRFLLIEKKFYGSKKILKSKLT